MHRRLRRQRLFSAAMLLMLGFGSSLSASAASFVFVQVGGPDLVQTGDTLFFDVVIDFTDEPTLGGSFDIAWDPAALSLEQLLYNPVGEPNLSTPPSVLDGRLQRWSFASASIDGISGVHVLGTLEFLVLPTMGSTTTIDFSCSGFQQCTFVSADDFVTTVPVDYQSAEISRVPVPAAGLLLASALVMLRAVRR